MSWGGSTSPGGKGGDDDMYDYDYSLDLNPGGAAGAGPAIVGFKPGKQQGRMMTGQQGRMMTGQQQGRMMTGQASRMGTSGGGVGGDLRPMTSVSGAGYQVITLTAQLHCAPPAQTPASTSS